MKETLNDIFNNIILNCIFIRNIFLIYFKIHSLKDQYSKILLKEYSIINLTQFNYELHVDPFKKNAYKHLTKRVYWNNNGAVTFDDQNLIEYLKMDTKINYPIIYTIYSDFNVQLNGKINQVFNIETIALRVANTYCIIDLEMGIEAFNHENSENGQFFVDFLNNFVRVETINVKFEIKIMTNEKNLEKQISIEFLKLNDFTHAYGLIGSTVRFKNDVIYKESSILRNRKIILNDWLVEPQEDIFSNVSPGQSWKNANDLKSNAFILEENFIIKKNKKISFHIEGQMLSNSGKNLIIKIDLKLLQKILYY